MFAICCMKLGKYSEAEKALEAEGSTVRSPSVTCLALVTEGHGMKFHASVCRFQMARMVISCLGGLRSSQIDMRKPFHILNAACFLTR
jgi:hypothetical protein